MAEAIKVWGEGTRGLRSPRKTVDVPDGYIEVPPGDPYITRRIKQRASVVYVRMKKRKRLGLSVVVGHLAPEGVVREAISEAERVRRREESRRNAAVREYRE